VRIPVGYRNGRVTSSAAGASSTLDVPALVAKYRSWGYHIVAVIGGRTNDVDVQQGDATKIMQALGFNGIEYTAPNEPGNLGKTLQDQVNLANMITAEGRALKPDFKIMGPVWAYYDRGQLGSFATSMGSKLGGLTFGPGVAAWNLTQCGAIHGHIKVAPDGTVYVPVKNCGDPPQAAVVVLAS